MFQNFFYALLTPATQKMSIFKVNFLNLLFFLQCTTGTYSHSLVWLIRFNFHILSFHVRFSYIFMNLVMCIFLVKYKLDLFLFQV